MNTIIKLAIISILSTSLFSISTSDKKVIDYIKKNIMSNSANTLHSLKLAEKKALDKSSKWNAYRLKLDITDKKINKRVTTPIIVFSNGKYITTQMIDMNTGLRFGENEARAFANKKRKEMEENFVLPKSYYKKSHLIAGNHNAKTKIIVFSDPLCVYCIKNVPTIIKGIKGRKDIALYYYDFPLDMHPTAKTVIKAMLKAKKDGIKDVELKVYTANFENFYDVYKTKDDKKALDAFNKLFKTKYTLKDIDTPSAKKHIENDVFDGLGANVSGTPSVLFNGSYKDSRSKLKQFLKKK